jgi:hypothetical protein
VDREGIHVGGSYSAEISRENPACVLFLLDQSYSMTEPLAGDSASRKANVAADAINNLIRTLIVRCTKNANEGPRDYYEIGVIGYGSQRGVGPCFGGALKGKVLVPTSELANKPLRVENRTRKIPDGSGGLTEVAVKFPVWFEPIAELDTPMLEAIQHARRVLNQWTAGHKKSYPPIVINITDGEPNEDPIAAARALTSLSVDDGNVLLYNLHLSMVAREPILFPASTAVLPDEFAAMLFEMSSVFPDKARLEFEVEGYSVDPGSRGFVFNTNAEALIRFIEVGTRTASKKGALGESSVR